MNKLFDLRFVIGAFFSIAGILLLVYALVTTETGQEINGWCGGVFLAFGLLMIFLSLQKDAQDELLEE
jgi:uncharacterized membrane protein HdeD (DUF308 family)